MKVKIASLEGPAGNFIAVCIASSGGSLFWSMASASILFILVTWECVGVFFCYSFVLFGLLGCCLHLRLVLCLWVCSRMGSFCCFSNSGVVNIFIEMVVVERVLGIWVQVYRDPG